MATPIVRLTLPCCAGGGGSDVGVMGSRSTGKVGVALDEGGKGSRTTGNAGVARDGVDEEDEDEGKSCCCGCTCCCC